jgi:hypothetical protein
MQKRRRDTSFNGFSNWDRYQPTSCRNEGASFSYLEVRAGEKGYSTEVPEGQINGNFDLKTRPWVMRGA